MSTNRLSGAGGDRRPGMQAPLAQRVMLWVVAILVVAVLPYVFPGGLGIAVLNQMFIMVVFTLAYNMLLGQGGMLSFGHAVFFGLGGYWAAHFVTWSVDMGWPIPLPLMPIVGGVAGVVFGGIIGSFSTARAGTVFAMISLGVGELIAASSLIFTSFSGGEEGVTMDRTEPARFFGQNFATELSGYYLIALWMLVTAFLMYRFSRTPLGRMANAVRDNPERAQFVGYSTRWVRFLSFVASGGFAGVAGALFAINYEIVTEETLNALTSGIVLLQAYIGGVGYFAGPIVGAVVFTLLQTLLSNYSEIWALYVGITFVAVVMYAPNGLTGLLMMHAPIWRHGSLKPLVKPYLICMVPAVLVLAGAIGLLEGVYALSSGEEELALWGMAFAPAEPMHWVLFFVLFGAGVWGAKRFAPAVADAYDHALKQAYHNASEGA